MCSGRWQDWSLNIQANLSILHLRNPQQAVRTRTLRLRLRLRLPSFILRCLQQLLIRHVKSLCRNVSDASPAFVPQRLCQRPITRVFGASR